MGDDIETGHHPSARPHRRERLARRSVEERGQALKERVYATFTGLAIVLVQLGNVDHLDAQTATSDLAVGIIGITLAGFVAELIADLAVQGRFASGARLKEMLRVASEALVSASVPVLLLAAAWIGLLQLESALLASRIVYIVTLGVIGYLAVRRTKLTWWRQTVALAALLGLAGLVLLFQQLAHGH